PVLQPQEIALGDAEIWTTVLGSEPKRYTVRIEQVNMTSSDPNRNLLIRVTDPELLEATGGIIQGMSGSPIVQNGRLVGAVTHVLVNDPARGYGIFASTMLQKADGIA
ncbi:MAG: SpoIVB peptidase S55 domain-containing protein, partial [Blautia massiliensis (ex Durand et al. 2017)]